jgi:hypothetical protein
MGGFTSGLKDFLQQSKKLFDNFDLSEKHVTCDENI